MKKLEPFLSIIVPVYNAGQFLEKCIRSIEGQTYRDMQIILVDDGSTDGSAELCDRHGAEDSRITVIHKPNGGLVSARKAGLKAATGAFIGWVDADDWVEPDYFGQMVQAQRESGADIVAAAHFHDIGTGSGKVCNAFPAGIYIREQLLPQLIYSGKFFEYGLQPHVYTKLIRKEILDKTQMAVDDRICAGEDAAVVYPSVVEADKVCMADICGYHYVQRQGSITKTRGADELGRFRVLASGLEDAFARRGVLDIMRPQMEQYEKYFLLLRQIQVLDQRILLPYGGIPLHSRVVLYGAGVLGQGLYRYLMGNQLAEIILWADQNYRNYQKQGMEVSEPAAIKGLDGQYEYVLIANTMESTADSIRKYLLGMQVPEEKIRWLSEGFINGGGVLFGKTSARETFLPEISVASGGRGKMLSSSLEVNQCIEY